MWPVNKVVLALFPGQGMHMLMFSMFVSKQSTFTMIDGIWAKSPYQQQLSVLR